MVGGVRIWWLVDDFGSGWIVEVFVSGWLVDVCGSEWLVDVCGSGWDVNVFGSGWLYYKNLDFAISFYVIDCSFFNKVHENVKMRNFVQKFPKSILRRPTLTITSNSNSRNDTHE